MLNCFLENNICTLIQLMITVLLDDPIICDLPIKVINRRVLIYFEFDFCLRFIHTTYKSHVT